MPISSVTVRLLLVSSLVCIIIARDIVKRPIASLSGIEAKIHDDFANFFNDAKALLNDDENDGSGENPQPNLGAGRGRGKGRGRPERGRGRGSSLVRGRSISGEKLTDNIQGDYKALLNNDGGDGSGENPQPNLGAGRGHGKGRGRGRGSSLVRGVSIYDEKVNNYIQGDSNDRMIQDTYNKFYDSRN